MSDAYVTAFGGYEPEIADDVFVAPTATVVGRVRLLAGASVWYAAVLRGDGDAIEVGPGSNIQDGVVVHADPGYPVHIGERVSVGHNATLHGCVIGDDVPVGMGATVLNGARVASFVLIAAGAVVLQGTEVPEGSLVAGVPGRVVRALTDDERKAVTGNAVEYARLAERYRLA